MPTEHILGVLEHKTEVGKNMSLVSTDLFERAVRHDFSKFHKEEHYLFETSTKELAKITYGSEEYAEALRKIRPAIEHHYKVNSHHPEHYTNGINDMNLLDVIEMVCDWMAAVKRHDDGDIMKSLKINRERFGIDDQLYGIIENTVKYLQDKE